jgi:hypothetical protein
MGKAYNVMAATCPSRTVLHRIGARWTVFVVNALADGPAASPTSRPISRASWAEQHVPDIEAARARHEDQQYADPA